MTSKSRVLLFSIFLLIAAFGSISNCSEPELIEPAFPVLIGSYSLNRHVMHIIAESYNTHNGVLKNVEEFVNVFSGKSLITTTINGKRSSLLYDVESGTRYEYSPFACETLTFLDLIKRDKAHTGFWTCKTTIAVNFKDGLRRVFEMNGLLAIWMNAGLNQKTYKKHTNHFRRDGRTSELPQTVHEWCMQDKETSQTFCLAFVRNRYEDLIIDKIEVFHSETSLLVESYKIVAFERLEENPYTHDILRPPVGYGCDYKKNHQRNAPILMPTIKNDVFLTPKDDPFRMKLEITATKYETERISSDRGNEQFKRSATSIVEVAFAKPIGRLDGMPYHMMRTRDSREEFKIVADREARTVFLIDVSRSQCSIHNMPDDLEGPELKKYFVIEFQNSMKLDLDMDKIEKLFTSPFGFEFVMSSDSLSAKENTFYFERSSNTLFSGKTARIVRYYSAEAVDTLNQTYKTQLEGVTVWLLNRNKRVIEESFHFSLIDIETISEAQNSYIFDISEECYLNNDKMKLGRDYAWLQVGYNLDPSQASLAIAEQNRIRHFIRLQLALKTDLHFFRVPRIELMFQPGGFRLRILVLDYLPIEFRYFTEARSAFRDDLKESAIQRHVAVDERHCAELCRLQDCKAMSFCQGEFSCVLSHVYDRDANKSSVVTRDGCRLFVKPPIKTKINKDGVVTVLDFPLASLISELSHTDFLAVRVPEIPEELTMSKNDFVSYSNQEYNAILADYWNRYVLALSEWPTIVQVWHLDSLINGYFTVFKPSMFLVESDPLAELDGGQLEDSIVDVDRHNSQAAFQTGKPASRYDTIALSEQNDIRWHGYDGLTYDQCAIACLDQICPSFSYCTGNKKCIIVDEIHTGSRPVIKPQRDCLIMQRNYLDKFQKFSNVYRSSNYKTKVEAALNPVQCALACFTESSFKCLAFDFCAPKDAISPSSCLMFEHRNILSPSDYNKSPVAPANRKLVPSAGNGTTGCDHYSRSYLADFVRIENRKLKEDRAVALMTQSVTGKSIDQCAETCVIELDNCSAFQFCLQHNVLFGFTQSCTMIENTSPKNADDYKQSEQTSKVSSMFEFSSDCHLFALPKGDSDISSRRQVIEVNSNDEFNVEGKLDVGKKVSLFKGVVICIGVTSLFTLLTVAASYAKNHNSYVRQRFEHLQIILNSRRR